jgi:hypothetical protein
MNPFIVDLFYETPHGRLSRSFALRAISQDMAIRIAIRRALKLSDSSYLVGGACTEVRTEPEMVTRHG